jgi:acyl-CoA thioester hydrolase
MARIRIDFPGSFPFTTLIAVRITDVNFGGHVGNDAILSIIHEARMQFLKHYGYSETDFGGSGLIMSDVVINYKNEAFYGDTFRISVGVTNISRVTFDVVYLIEKESSRLKSHLSPLTVTVAEAKTGMVCFDYSRRKVTALPEEAKIKWNA